MKQLRQISGQTFANTRSLPLLSNMGQGFEHLETPQAPDRHTHAPVSFVRQYELH